MAKEAITFRPARPPWREAWPAAVMSIITAVLLISLTFDPEKKALGPLAAALILLAGALFLLLRHRFPGDPRLIVDETGLRYCRGNRERALKWNELSSILTNGTGDTMIFVGKGDGQRITTYCRMVAADGFDWAMMIEDYWDPGKRRAVP